MGQALRHPGPGGPPPQHHVLSFLGAFWGRGAPRIEEDLVVAYSREVVRTGGAITWDVPVDEARMPCAEHLALVAAAGRVLPRWLADVARP